MRAADPPRTRLGVGLWLDQLWAEYLTLIATSLFIPFELYELAVRPSLWKAGGLRDDVTARPSQA